MSNNIKRALISVSDKSNILEISQFLLDNNYIIYSTGGTLKHIQTNITHDNIRSIQELTNYPEILDGRVKTLHPHIYGGLLANMSNNNHITELSSLGLNPFDVVIVNLYPFEKTIKSNPNDFQNCIENIDIGGVSLIRASSKNFNTISLLCETSDYNVFTENHSNITMEMRRQWAIKGFKITSNYDNMIQNYYENISFNDNSESSFNNNTFGENCNNNEIALKYGFNPHQPASMKFTTNDKPFEILNGSLGIINVMDMIHGWLMTREIQDLIEYPAVISMKHTSPAGLSIGTTSDEITKLMFGIEGELSPTASAFIKSRNCDPLSSFGDFIICSDKIDVQTALLIKREVADGIMASDFDDEALEILKSKKKGKFIVIRGNMDYYRNMIESGWSESKEMYGVNMRQTNNNYRFNMGDLKAMTSLENYNMDDKFISLVVGYMSLKYTQSNNVSLCYDGNLIGMGTGQQNRVDCVKLAGRKARKWILRRHPRTIEYFKSIGSEYKRQEKVNMVYEWVDNNLTDMDYDEMKKSFDLVLCSDGFFPFPDNIDVANLLGVKYILQPAGSIQDENVANRCDEYGIQMASTGFRMFYH